jgi:hypothetical protein
VAMAMASVHKCCVKRIVVSRNAPAFWASARQKYSFDRLTHPPLPVLSPTLFDRYIDSGTIATSLHVSSTPSKPLTARPTQAARH